ncbi:MAG: hydroxyphenylacetyl-CoA thioesterase PaaI [Alphaproteobacteria bacterium]|nr:hydroxyphenylacetyl-CoA thioesterase PaaI [Alphaproteobacteria bacterium]
MTPQAVAEAVGQGMYARDRAARALGITLDEIAPGLARMRMAVGPDMVNGHDICHGGMIFTLADTAFAYACNSYNHVTVAQTAQISFVSAARAGDLLTAEAREVSRSGRTGIYDIRVSDQRDRLVALFRGNSYRLSGEVVPGLAPAAPADAREGG